MQRLKKGKKRKKRWRLATEKRDDLTGGSRQPQSLCPPPQQPQYCETVTRHWSAAGSGLSSSDGKGNSSGAVHFGECTAPCRPQGSQRASRCTRTGKGPATLFRTRPKGRDDKLLVPLYRRCEEGKQTRVAASRSRTTAAVGLQEAVSRGTHPDRSCAD